LFGNIKLIGELYCLGHISDKIIKECFVFLLREINDHNVEILCLLIEKVGNHLIKPSNLGNARKNKGYHPSFEEDLMDQLTDDILEDIIHKILSMKSDKKLSSKIRFKIQDLIELYDLKWKPILTNRNKVVKVLQYI
jgi:hypothetical protein